MEGAEARAKRNLILTHVVLIIMAFIMLVPFAWMILTALKTNQEAISVNPFYIFPANGWHWENFATVWKSYNFIILYKNTILMIFFRVVCACLTATMAGYAFGRLKFPFKNALFALVLIQMMVPGQIFIIPQYLMVSRLGMLNTTFGLVFPGLVTAFGTYLLKTGYEQLPMELEEAASIDGCSVPGRFLHILMPLTRSSMVSLGIFTAVFAFKDLMWPMIVCTNAKYHHPFRGPGKDAGPVWKRVSHHDGCRYSGSTAYGDHLRHLPETVRGRYRDLRRKTVRNKCYSPAGNEE